MLARASFVAMVLLGSCGRVGFDPLARGDGGGERDGGVDRDGGRDDGASGGDGGPVEPNVMFVTSKLSWQSGLTAADDTCQAAAESAGIEGTFVAWLSTSTMNARDRLAGARGWVRTDGLPFADRVEDLIAGVIYYPPALDENGDPGGGFPVATGTLPDGTRADNCNDLGTTGSMQVGDTVGGTDVWTWSSLHSCGSMFLLYCFGIDRVAMTAPPTPTGPLAFITNGSIRAPSSIATADALCQGEADAAGLGGRTFRALLATSGGAALDGFTRTEWFRVDGARIVFPPITALDVTIAGSRDAGTLSVVWVGADQATTPGTLESACDDWTDPSLTGIALGNFHVASYSDLAISCSNQGRVRCLEQ